MDIYNYHKQTFEYTHTTQASESPREPGVYLIPAFSTTISPPTLGSNEVAIFDVDTTSWLTEVDHRGETVYDITNPHVSKIVKVIGDIDPAFTLEVPAYPMYDEWNGTTWEPNLATAKLARIAETKNVAYQKIVAIMPEWKQRNSLARTSELLRKEQKGTIIQAETDELDALETEWNNTIQPIRTASDAIEAEIDALTLIEDIIAYDVTTNVLWP